MATLGYSPLFYDTLEANLVGTLQQNIIYPSVTTMITAPKGSSFLWSSVKRRLTAETITTGTEGESATLEFERNILDLTEKGVTPRIYDNDINDARWDVVQTTLDEVGKAMARAMNEDMVTAIDSAVPATNVVAATNTWASDDADILLDLKNGADTVFDDDGKPDALIMNPTDYTSMWVQPDFLRATQQGDKMLIEGAIDKVLNMSIFTTTAVTAGSVYGLNSQETVNFYEREAFSTEFRKPSRERATDIIAWARYGFAVIRPENLFKITGAV